MSFSGWHSISLATVGRASIYVQRVRNIAFWDVCSDSLVLTGSAQTVTVSGLARTGRRDSEHLKSRDWFYLVVLVGSVVNRHEILDNDMMLVNVTTYLTTEVRY